VSTVISHLSRALQSDDPTQLPHHGKPQHHASVQYPIWRLQQAWRGAFGPDEAVLVRQALRWAGGQIFAPQLPENIRNPLQHAGVYADEAGRLTADAFVPAWLDNIDLGTGIDPPPVSRVPKEDVPAETYVTASFGYPRWKSQALKEACWHALRAAPGATTLIALPTGSGKSLCFHYLARFSTGLTLVIVPTVALAIDQYRAARELPLLAHLDARYFAADDPDFTAQQVADAVRTGSTRLLFTSPEACVSGRLRSVIDELASQGRLDHVVIDEAHMVGTWGIYFRVDFQLLSTHWRQWRERSGHQLRTLLLSATFTPECREGLKTLFPAQEWSEFISQRLRPEIAYHVREFSAITDRNAAALECIWQMPRPAIVYTTRVDDAYAFHRRVQQEGFRRVECFTGETPRAQRRTLLERWRADDIDVMVATSAFGLGVDKPDVRTIVHACIPENLDRFYQEVGRGGRDGYSAASILLATKQDVHVAKGMGPSLLRPETIQQRWESLWRTHECVNREKHEYRVNLRTKKEELAGTRTYEENVRWNKRLLLQLLRAGKLDIIDLRRDRDGEPEQEWATLALRFPPQSPDVSALIGPVRQHELDMLQQGLQHMLDCLSGQDRICAVLHDLYGKQTVRTCGGCPGCRSMRRIPGECGALPLPPVITTVPQVHVVMGLPSLAQSSEVRQLARWLRRARQVRNVVLFACADPYVARLLDACSEAFGPDPQPYRVDGLGPDKPGWEPPFRLAPTENLVVLHADTVHRGIWHAGWGQTITHWICAGCREFDERGKLWGAYKGVRPFGSPELWTEAGAQHVYP
jgi:ATP-dependent DNA helicase RecQ